MYGVGAFLLAGSEVYRLIGDFAPLPSAATTARPRFACSRSLRQGRPGDISFVHEAERWFPQTGGEIQLPLRHHVRLEQPQSRLLSKYEVVVFLDTRPEDPAQRAAFQTYMEHGGAWMGFHFAGFALTPSAFPANWNWYHDTFLGAGSYASNTWRPTSAILRVEDRAHPATQDLPADVQVIAERVVPLGERSPARIPTSTFCCPSTRPVSR